MLFNIIKLQLNFTKEWVFLSWSLTLTIITLITSLILANCLAFFSMVVEKEWGGGNGLKVFGKILD